MIVYKFEHQIFIKSKYFLFNVNSVADYVKHLPNDSTDMTNATEALDLVTKAANHSNEALKKIV